MLIFLFFSRMYYHHPFFAAFFLSFFNLHGLWVICSHVDLIGTFWLARPSPAYESRCTGVFSFSYVPFYGWDMDMGMDTNMELHLMFSSLPVEFMDRIVDDLDVLYCG